MDQPGSAAGRWVPPGQPATVAGHTIPGGLFYIGRHLRTPTGQVEPALINPDLPVAAPGAASVEPGPGAALAYHLISPAARTAYLGWLAGGRDAEVSTSLVLLFCFGLERRVLADADHDPAVRRELPAIAAEARRLRARYGDGSPTLRGALDRLLDLLELMAASRTAPGGATSSGAATGPPPTWAERAPAGGRASVPMTVRVALARFAAAAAPVPADWARAWVRHHPALTPRSVQARCPDEFDRLFALRYRDRHGAGLVPPDDVPGVRLRYQPASSGLTATLVCREDLPDVLAEPRSTRTLTALVDAVAAALDPYSRWLARFPQGRGSLVAATLLPAELVDPDRGPLGALRVWAEARLDGRPWRVIDAAEFWAFWSTATPERMTRDEAATFIGVLALLGIGVEPDVRFGTPALAPGPAVLFRLGRPANGRPAADRPAARFRAAAAVARCAAAVASAAGPVDPEGQVGAAVLATVRDLAAPLRLDPGDAPRLTARLGWLLATGVDIDRLGRQTALLDEDARELAGRYLIPVAGTADPAVGPATVARLTRVYRILGLDPDLVFPRLHEQSLGGPPTCTRRGAPPGAAGSPGPVGPAWSDVRDEPTGSPGWDRPVVVRPADAVANGYALPWAATPPPPAGPPAAPPPAAGPPAAVPPVAPRAGAGGAASDGVPLDHAAITRKFAESAAAATLLTTIFDPNPSPAEPPANPAEPPADGAEPTADGAERVAGLDGAHSRLLRALATRPSWTPDEFAVLASTHGVLPDGALDLLNEVAIDTVGSPVVEDDVTLAVNNDVVLELLA